MLVILVYCDFISTAKCDHKKQGASSDPYGPSSLWFSSRSEWRLGNTSIDAVHLLGHPTHPALGIEPIAISLENRNPRIGKVGAKAANPNPEALCSFEGLIWTLRDQFGYAARMVLGSDQSLIGFSFRVWNNSMNPPLILVRQTGGPLFGISISIDEMRWSVPKSAGICEEWTLKPREKEDVFVPLRDLLPEGFDPKNSVRCYFSVEVNAVPKIPKSNFGRIESPFPHVSGMPALISKAGLAIDPKEALKEAEKDASEHFKKR